MNIFVDESGQFRVHEKPTGIINYECMVGFVIGDGLLVD